MGKHRSPRLEDWDLLERQHRVSKIIAHVILPVGIFALVGILAGLALAEVVM